jgi:exoribonuclease-2
MHSQRQHQRSDLVRIATHVMAERGLEPEFSRRVEQQLAGLTGPGRDDGPDVHDLTHLLWCSIDNDDSLDLDQLTVCEAAALRAPSACGWPSPMSMRW